MLIWNRSTSLIEEIKQLQHENQKNIDKRARHKNALEKLKIYLKIYSSDFEKNNDGVVL